jgi:phosphoribosylglycinamide formyltransferase-1
MRKIRTAVLISGRGSNMVALTEAAQADEFPADICLVISNISTAAGLEKAKQRGVTAMTIDHKQFKSRRKFETALDAVLQEAKIELVCCAGFMRVLTPWFVNRWQNRLLNIHPSLLPKYKGLNTHQRALDAGDKKHGCTVHYVTAELDGGATILQHSIDIKPSDTAESLAQRLLPYEQSLYAKALKKVSTKLLAKLSI